MDLIEGRFARPGSAVLRPRALRGVESACQLDSTLFECPVCLDRYAAKAKSSAAPVVLKCGHTLCRTDARALLLHREEGVGVAIACPLCRQLTRPGASGADALPTNFSLLSLLQRAALAQAVDGDQRHEEQQAEEAPDGPLEGCALVELRVRLPRAARRGAARRKAS